MKILDVVSSFWKRGTKNSRTEKDPFDTGWDRLPRNRDYFVALNHPQFRRCLVEASIEEDEINSWYQGILNTISENCVGPTPLILGDDNMPEASDEIEDAWLGWCVNNEIGCAIRQIRREAAKTGIGIGIPYTKIDALDQVKLSFKVYGFNDLQQPRNLGTEKKIYDGIEYNEHWDIIKIYLKNGSSEPTEYNIDECIVWSKKLKSGIKQYIPECGAAFQLYPSIRRYMKSIVKGEEMKSAIPMAVKLDPAVWKPENAEDIPHGKWEYEPGMVPTLPPGTDLTGLQFGALSQDRAEFIGLVVGASARCVQMPKNLAMGDSSGHNMATAAIDIIPWKNRVAIDRTDFEPVTRKIYRMWAQEARRIPDYLSKAAAQIALNFRFKLNYTLLFEHPDPGKNANSRMTDLISGSSTLHRVYTSQGLNPRRELEREAKLMGISIKELYQIILTSRTLATLQILSDLEKTGTQDGNQSSKK